MTQCMMGCEGTKGQHCTNLTFGCYAQSGVCIDFGQCVLDNLETGL
jgi:hypothetical protein